MKIIWMSSKLVMICIMTLLSLHASHAEVDLECQQKIFKYRMKYKFDKAAGVATECCYDKADGYSCNQLGFLAELNAIKSDKKPSEYYKKACDLKYAGGCKNLGSNYKRVKDTNNAKIYYQKACDLKDSDACVEIMLLD